MSSKPPNAFDLSPEEKLGRRAFLRHLVVGGALAVSLPGLSQLLAACRQEARPKDVARAEMILRNSRPLDLETPVAYFDRYLTPNEVFFVRTHHDEPRLDPAKWRLRVEGLVDGPLELTLDALKAFPRHEVTAVLQCSGNGRAFFEPGMPGVQWEKGAVGNARWAGARLGDVLKKAGLRPDGRHVVLQGADQPVIAKTPRFGRSVPIEKALHPDTLLAYEMNGEPLPYLHGYPVRVVPPGWVGDDWVKWLELIRVQAEPFDGFFMKTAYRYPTRPLKPGEAVDSKDMAPMDEMVVKSLIASPAKDAKLKAGAVKVQGVAWTGGDARIARVEVSTDGGASWREAEVFGEDRPYAWRQWRTSWTPPAAGTYTIMARATDSRGHTQPIGQSPWNPSGYQWNTVDAIPVTIQA